MDSKHVIEGFEDFHVRIDGHNIPVGPMRFEEVRFWKFWYHANLFKPSRADLQTHE